MSNRACEILCEFEGELKLRGRSDATIEHYSIHIRLFIKYTGMDPRHVTSKDITEYISYLYTENYALNTIKLKIRSLIQFYRYLYKRGFILINPVESIKEPSGVIF